MDESIGRCERGSSNRELDSVWRREEWVVDEIREGKSISISMCERTGRRSQHKIY